MARIAREFLEAIVLAAIVFVLIQTSVQNFKVEGSSMDPTLEDNQYLLVNKLVYFKLNPERLSRIIPFWSLDKSSERFAFHPPNRGEVIVFHFPRDPKRDFVKRVVGLPGDQVEIRQGVVYTNGIPLDEPYLTDPGNFSSNRPVQLGEKEYYVLGDNRQSSNDSRSWGPVPEENVVGKVWVIYWPIPKWDFLGSISSVAQGIFR